MNKLIFFHNKRLYIDAVEDYLETCKEIGENLERGDIIKEIVLRRNDIVGKKLRRLIN